MTDREMRNEYSVFTNKAILKAGAKKGFEVIWAMSETEKGDSDLPVAKVKGIYIADVCESGNFGELGI